MHLSVVNDDANVASVATCERSLLHAAHDTLEDSWHETCVDSTTDNAVDEDNLSAPFEIDFFLALNVNLELLTAKLI